MSTPVKKEFVTYWSIESMRPQSLRVQGLPFFDTTRFESKKESVQVNAVIPDAVNFLDLIVFDGKKTRITIEVIE